MSKTDDEINEQIARVAHFENALAQRIQLDVELMRRGHEYQEEIRRLANQHDAWRTKHQQLVVEADRVLNEAREAVGGANKAASPVSMEELIGRFGDLFGDSFKKEPK